MCAGRYVLVCDTDPFGENENMKVQEIRSLMVFSRVCALSIVTLHLVILYMIGLLFHHYSCLYEYATGSNDKVQDILTHSGSRAIIHSIHYSINL